VDGSSRGVLNLNKPSGPTSRDVVNQVARSLGRVRVGHAGTLDPLASGVLVVCVGSTTRLIDSIQRMPKTYRAVIRMGARSDTLDAQGRVEHVADPPIPSEAEVRQAVSTQVGEILQVPPEYSALKVQGRRAHELARAGREVDLAPRSVRVDRIGLVSYAWPLLELEIDCGGGTYIRSLARDLGEALGCGGFVEVLSRTRIGPFTLVDAVDPSTLTRASLPGRLLSPLAAVPDLPRVVLDSVQVAEIMMGRSIASGLLAVPSPPSGPVALLGPDGGLIAIAEVDPAGNIQPRKVLA
jgi:tRNA pseudouridine55 synthase